MAGPAVKTPFQFGGSLVANPNVAVWGSKSISSPAYSLDPETIQSAQWLQGIFPALVAGNAPYWQDENGFHFVVMYFLKYLMTRGVPEWNSNLVSTGPNVSKTTYYTGDLVRRGPVPATANTTVWQCQADGITSDPLQDGTNWVPWIQTLISPNLCKAFVTFDGTTGAILNSSASFNVSSVTRVSQGHYRVNFANAMPVDGGGNGIYAMAGSAGTQNGATPAPGDNNIICGGTGGGAVVRTASACDVFCWEAAAGGGQLEDSGCISVMFFGP